jgi:long-chain acyl-CoA synthetase
MSHALLHAWEKTLRRGSGRAVTQAADGSSASFIELDLRATAWRQTHAPEPGRLNGSIVAFAAENGLSWLEVFLGLLKAGAVLAPLDAAEPPPAQRALATSLRAAFWWNGARLEALAGAKRHRDHAVCLIKLTSGTTGRARALAFTAGQLLADGRQVTATMGIGPRDLNYALIAFGHSYGLGNLILPLVAQGVSMIVGTAPLPHAIAADFARWKPTVFPGVPALWRALAASELALPGLRLGISAGAPLPPEVARDFAARFGQRLHNFYGSSETGGIAYDRTGKGALAGKIGPAIKGVKLTALDGGKLQVSSPAVMTHGHRRRCGKLGAWIMPDRAHLDWRGRVTLLGRRGQTVKIAGRRVNLAEVADRLRKLPGVRDAWVGVGTGREPALEAVVATDRAAPELRAALLADTARWKIPKKLKLVAALPLTARGKTDVRALRAMMA